MSGPNAAFSEPRERDDELPLATPPAAPSMPPAVALEVETVRNKLAALRQSAVAWEQASKTDPAALAEATAGLAKAAEEGRAAVVHLTRTLDATVSRKQRKG